ncbi:hypothetical protein BT67DRAFT_436227 [Trichocladium antarcticum]|uniref:Uncharacterized protein n=1 Tax=Trichocladium antarcticum TaxID=1450529 RepID=A0AAN6ZBP4_9PEZI|nr:hypothetical protein BT67DRAFT_436227 [Trichocladium antarcticum]
MPGPWLTALLATQMTASPPGGSTSDPSPGHCRSAWHAKGPMESEDRQEGRNGETRSRRSVANARGNEPSGSRALEMSGKSVPGKWAVGPGEARMGWGFVERVPDPQLVKDPASWDSQVPSGRGETEQGGRRVDHGRQLQLAASAAEANAAGALHGEVGGGETGRKPFRLAGLQGCIPLKSLSTFYCEAWPPTGPEPCRQRFRRVVIAALSGIHWGPVDAKGPAEPKDN